MMYSILKVSPKACGHTQGRKVVSREEAIMHIKAAVDARKESGSDIVIVARTDSRQALSLDEAIWRAGAFADAGADVVFIDALASREEMKAFCAVSPGVPKMVRSTLWSSALF
jgi:2-methylisocitrate lyase-like PEP mutase family enzyme